jgi:undecaprenyl-diphosphatase
MNALDTLIFGWLNLGPQAPGWLLTFARGASANLPHWLIASALTMALMGPRPTRSHAWCTLASMGLASLTSHVLKGLFHFPRPGSLELGHQWLDHGLGPGFPSSHASVAMAFAGALWLAPLRWPIKAGALLCALAISWSRVALGLHFPSDVVAGWCLGTLCACAVSAVATKWRSRGTRTARPSPAPGPSSPPTPP